MKPKMFLLLVVLVATAFLLQGCNDRSLVDEQQARDYADPEGQEVVNGDPGGGEGPGDPWPEEVVNRPVGR
jgi:hypothetical protein